MMYVSTSLIFIWCIGNALTVEARNQPVQSFFEKSVKPCGFTETCDDVRTDGIIEFDKQSAVPRTGEGIVAEAAERPDLWAII